MLDIKLIKHLKKSLPVEIQVWEECAINPNLFHRYDVPSFSYYHNNPLEENDMKMIRRGTNWEIKINEIGKILLINLINVKRCKIRKFSDKNNIYENLRLLDNHISPKFFNLRRINKTIWRIEFGRIFSDFETKDNIPNVDFISYFRKNIEKDPIEIYKNLCKKLNNNSLNVL